MSELAVRTIFGKADRLDMTDEQLIFFAFQGKKVYVVSEDYTRLDIARRRLQNCLEATESYDLTWVMTEGSKLWSIRFERGGGEIIFAKGDERGDWARGRTFYGGVGSAPDWIHLEP